MPGHELAQLDGKLGMLAGRQRRVRVVRLYRESLLVERGCLDGEAVGHLGDVGQRGPRQSASAWPSALAAASASPERAASRPRLASAANKATSGLGRTELQLISGRAGGRSRVLSRCGSIAMSRLRSCTPARADCPHAAGLPRRATIPRSAPTLTPPHPVGRERQQGQQRSEPLLGDRDGLTAR